MTESIFLDTAYIQALLNRRDYFHEIALSLLPRVQTAREAWVTEAVLVEVGNALSAYDRSAVVWFIRQSYRTKNLRVVAVNADLFQRGVTLYEARPDKTWGLTDCISFTVMREQGLIVAATSDRHFIQAGFRALMVES